MVPGSEPHRWHQVPESHEAQGVWGRLRREAHPHLLVSWHLNTSLTLTLTSLSYAAPLPTQGPWDPAGTGPSPRPHPGTCMGA
jgi:hypothetical protein